MDHDFSNDDNYSFEMCLPIECKSQVAPCSPRRAQNKQNWTNHEEMAGKSRSGRSTCKQAGEQNKMHRTRTSRPLM
ncbi:hypothetical protein MPTK1_5g13280 [Marchantia polymorpha subsp. ruderalis]|uniref:Uncharacterized protein n=1 Tax=Marchantia polymorpha subsp. ruderalis TaxID=1480154 RepID=A0AAF6BHW8_MARPO|nr:hypothetical protein Mp_5g13280 [Marchantia polymorpha subsp. ruderalis]